MIANRRPPPRVPRTAAESPPWGFLEWFVIWQNVLPAVLFVPGTQPFRVPIRMAPFLLGLAGFAFLRGKSRLVPTHPSVKWLVWAVVYLVLMIFHPTTNTYLAAVAQVFLYVSVMAPILWAPRLVESTAQVKRVLLLMLVLNGLNAVVGLLQIYDPGTWMPKELSDVVMKGVYGVAGLTFVGPNGQEMLRPPGLTDNPGAAAIAGAMSGILGAIFMVAPSSFLVKTMAAIFAASGAVVIYLTHVRTFLVVLIGMLAIYGFRLILTYWKGRALLFIGLGAILVVYGLHTAEEMGGGTVATRVQTLEHNPLDVYYKNRGQMLAVDFTSYLAKYPFGAGLGRWGMMRYYFGDESNPDSPRLWSEIQYPSFILDGGIFLLFFYCLALIIAVVQELRHARTIPDQELRIWAVAVLAVNCGVLATTFSYVPFTAQLGVRFWYLTGVLHGAAFLSARQHDEAVRAG